MRILGIAGNVLATLGMLCGLFLLLSPVTAAVAWGLLLSGKTLALGLLFVLLSWMGLVLGGMGGGKLSADRLLSRLGSGWLLLGVLAIMALLAHLVGLINAEVTLVWWLMAAGCSLVGAIALTMGSDAHSSQSS
jgi:hypothetical protein